MHLHSIIINLGGKHSIYMSFRICCRGEYPYYYGADYPLIKHYKYYFSHNYRDILAVAIESQLTSMLQLITFAATSLNSARHHVSDLCSLET